MTDFIFFTHFVRFSDILDIFSDNEKFRKLIRKFKDHILHKDEIMEFISNKEVYLDFSFVVNGQKRKTRGIIKFLPFFPIDFIKDHEQKISAYIKKRCITAKREGARLVGLGGFSSIISDRGLALARTVGIAVTTGNTLTAASIITSLGDIMRKLRPNLQTTRILIIGASGDIGSICTRILSKCPSNRLSLVARDRDKLAATFSDIIDKPNMSLVSLNNLGEALKRADVILLVTSSIMPFISIASLRPGTIVCDASYPANITNEGSKMRNDILLYEGGKALMPIGKFINNLIWKRSFPENIIFGCLAETIVLSLEKTFVNFSIGRGLINESSVNRIFHLASECGFTFSRYKWGQKIYTIRDFDIMRRYQGKK